MREWLSKTESETDFKYGCMPKDRPIRDYLSNGIVNIDKPKGPTSHTVADWVKKMLGAKKTGHSGTLDPAVTGVLPICIDNATKVVQALLLSPKEYVCVMRMHRPLPEEEIKKLCKKFVGTIYQKPPLKSAVVRKLRPRRVYYLDVLEVDGQDVLFKIGCEAGTYVRTICHQLGKESVGAHMSELRRTASGPFDERTIVSLIELRDAYEFFKEGEEKYLRKFVQPVEAAIRDLPKVVIHDSAVNPVCNGSPLMVPGISKLESGMKPDDLVAILTLKGELVALGRALMPSQEVMDRKKGIAVKTDRVIMKLGTYPRKIKS